MSAPGSPTAGGRRGPSRKPAGPMPAALWARRSWRRAGGGAGATTPAAAEGGLPAPRDDVRDLAALHSSIDTCVFRGAQGYLCQKHNFPETSSECLPMVSS